MTFAELPREERTEIRERIEAIIGKKDDCVKDGMDISQRIKARSQYDKTFERMAKVYIKHGAKALSLHFKDEGWRKSGVTPNGKKWALEMNNGMTDRSRYCGTLWIDGEAIFTSGTLDKSFEYILNN